MKIYHKLLELDKSVFLKIGVFLSIVLCAFGFMPVFATIFLSFSNLLRIGGAIGKLPVQFLFNSLLISAGCGVSGFLMSIMVALLSRGKEMRTVIFAAIMVAILHILYWSLFIPGSLFFMVYWSLNILLNVIFLFGFTVLGAWLFTKRNRLKMQEAR